jgi:hypothetical protein
MLLSQKEHIIPFGRTIVRYFPVSTQCLGLQGLFFPVSFYDQSIIYFLMNNIPATSCCYRGILEITGLF